MKAMISAGLELQKAGDPMGAAQKFWSVCIAEDLGCVLYLKVAMQELYPVDLAAAAAQAMCIRGDATACTMAEEMQAKARPTEARKAFVAEFLADVLKAQALDAEIAGLEENQRALEDSLRETDAKARDIAQQKRAAQAKVRELKEARREEERKREIAKFEMELLGAIVAVGEASLEGDISAVMGLAEAACPRQTSPDVLQSIELNASAGSAWTPEIARTDIGSACFQVGKAYAAQGNRPEALAFQTVACELGLSDGCHRGLELVAATASAERDAESAFRLARLTLALPTDAETWIDAPGMASLLGSTAHQAHVHGRAEEGLSFADYALELDPDNPDARFARGQIRLTALGDPQGAVEDFTSFVRARPGKAGGMFLRARAHQAIGEERKAYRDYAAALALIPDHTEARQGRAYLGLRLGHYATVRQDYTYLIDRTDPDRGAPTKAAEVAPALRVYYWNRGQAREALGDLAGARKDKAAAARWEAHGG
ncbi:tetratricopeptide repeat protein [Roseivivax sp. CAU 1761]